MKVNRNKFTLDKMTEELDKIITPLIENTPDEVQLKLPKLKKLGSKQTEIKRPKLKKITSQVSS